MKPTAYTISRRKRENKLNQLHKQGIYQLIPNDEMKAHIRMLREHMTGTEIGKRSGVDGKTIMSHVQEHRGLRRVTREIAQKVLSVELDPDDLTVAERTRGGYRMIGGMLALGWTYAVIADHISLSYRSIGALMSGASDSRTSDSRYHAVGAKVYRELLVVCGKLEAANPQDYGITPSASHRARTLALQRHRPPLGCWDLDTIHRDDVLPEYTGACGTERGYRLHYTYKTVIELRRNQDGTWHTVKCCDPCNTARHITRKWPHLGHLMGCAVEGGRGRYERDESW